MEKNLGICKNMRKIFNSKLIYTITQKVNINTNTIISIGYKYFNES